MSKKTQSTAYTFVSARIRALENGLIGRDRIAQLAEAENIDALYARLEEYGVALVRDESGVQIEPTLSGILERALTDITEHAPAPEVFDFLRYPYDCHNIKSAIKSYLRNLPCESMLFALGTVAPALVASMPVQGDFAALPTEMAKAAPRALQAYEKTGNPRAIDLILDKACFADMLRCASESGEGFHVQLVRTQIDLVNLMICLRLVRMEAGEQGGVLLEQALLDGGMLDAKALLDAYARGQDAVLYLLNRTPYEKLGRLIAESDGTAAAAERLADDFRMELIRSAKQTIFGAPVLTAYFYAQEYATRNVRIVIAAKKAGLSPEIIHERIRTSYV
jgi:V/A-type H+-transporting ATPase subunit C